MGTIETNRAKIVSRLTADGWTLARHGSGHDVYTHPTLSPPPVIVPRHRELSPGVARQIAKTAGWL